MSFTSDATGLGREVIDSFRALRRNDARHSPAPPDTGHVLDIGAGHAPAPRADLVVDKYAADDFERNTTLSFAKPLVIGDGEAIPFAAGTFAYVVASHVLEHALDPVRFAAELSRVGRAGFVQVPSRESEVTFGWPFHPWLIDKDGETLVFHPRGELKAPMGSYFHESFRDSRLFALWFGANRDVWHHTVHWTGAIAVRVEGTSRAEQTAELDVERTLSVLARAGAHGPSGELRDALRCPVDSGVLREADGRLECATCSRAYPLAGTVPVLLAEAAR